MVTARDSKWSLGRVLLGALLCLVCFRSWVPVTTYVHFDSDQAVFGLMGRDLVAGRSLPLFMYGQKYLLAVSVWLCAPLFALFGSTITTLNLPIFALNIAVVLMMWRGLRREEELGPWGATIAILPFAMPNALVGTRLLEHAGGNIEPFVFTLGTFLLRERALALGIWAGIGFLNREFSLIGLVALVLMDLYQGVLPRRLRFYGIVAALIAAVSLSIRFVAAHWSTAYKGHPAGIGRPSLDNLRGLLEQQLPTLFGLMPRDLHDYNIGSHVRVGHVSVLFALLAWLGMVALVLLWREPLRRKELNGMSTYLLLVGLGQAASFWMFSWTGFDQMLVRYVLMTLLALCGACALAWKRPALRPLTVAVIGCVSLFQLVGHVRLASEYLPGRRPTRDINQLADELMQRGVRYATGEYWTSYDLAWVTQERIIAAPPDGKNYRMPAYNAKLASHLDETYRLEDQPCAGGERVLRWYVCPPPQAAR